MHFPKFVLSALALVATASAAPADVGQAGIPASAKGDHVGVGASAAPNGITPRWSVAFGFMVTFTFPRRETVKLDMDGEAYKCYSRRDIVNFLTSDDATMEEVTNITVSNGYYLKTYWTEDCSGVFDNQDFHGAKGFEAYRDA
ncbi:hypothetical protein B0H11DRAFT_2387336 [Mycena galericulata]|nr:hypothetical protein B0H11DRAFT_2387336 [Mycena galericulata]